MVNKLILLFMIISYSAMGAKLYCRSNTNNIYIKSNSKELNIDDFNFISDSSNPGWINCNLFINSLFLDGDISIKYKPLFNLTSARLLSDRIIEKCIDFRYCKLNVSSVLSRPKILFKFLKKKYSRFSTSFFKPDKALFNNDLLDLSNEKLTLLKDYSSPVDVAFSNGKTLEVISTMTFDTDALEQVIKWAKENPSRTLNIYFAAQLQFLIDKVDLSLLDQFKNIMLHPIFFSKDLPNSFHIKSIIHSNSLVLFTINLKKSNFLLNDAFIRVESNRANKKVKDILSSIDFVNCQNIDESDFFVSHYLNYKKLYLKYKKFCESIDPKELTSSRLSLDQLDKSKNYQMFTHILHPFTVKEFVNSMFYTSKLSVDDNFSNVLYNYRNHYKFILGDKCVFYSSSNLTPTAFGNIGEIAFKSCNRDFYKVMSNLANEIKVEYKRQDVL